MFGGICGNEKGRGFLGKQSWIIWKKTYYIMPEWKYKIASLPKSTGQEEWHPVTDALLSERGYTTKEARDIFLSPNFDRDIHDPFLFLEMEKIVTRLGEARANLETVGVFGDFDADGVTSSVIMREALQAIGVPVEVYIPEKVNEGHGFNLLAVDFFESKGIKLVLTLDCGIMNHDVILEAKRRGIATIVIDHHHVPEVMPEAYAIVNPKVPTEKYPFRELCGAGTSFKVAQALYMRYLPKEIDQLKWLLDVVATGTVADVMPLIGENRCIVKYGLIVLSKTKRVGFQEMFAVGRIPIDAEHLPNARMIGFQIAPRINAASRMAHAMLAHRLLMERDQAEARVLALELDDCNVRRQKVSTEVTDRVRKIALEKFADKKFIFAADEHFPYGVVGLIAGRIANELHKPTCVMTKGETTSTGSFRSIPELNIIETLEECGDMLEKFGGHAQAAGMTIQNDRMDAFYDKFNAIVEKKLADVVTEPEQWIDLVLEPEHITPKLYRDISAFAPFGEGNPEPVFVLRNMVVREARLVGNGSKHWKLSLVPQGGIKCLDAIGFSLGTNFPDLKENDVLDIAFTIDENTWNGSTSLQLKLVDIKRK
jgi:single-stranded-DNA-specific exonuclease